MMRPTVISRSQSAAKVTHYYAGGADDYYANDGTAMQWQGEGAAALGLAGAVEPERFRVLLNGQIDPATQLRRAANGAFNRERLAFDFTFSTPKSVSLQALVAGDKRVLAIHNAAVAAAIKEAEALACARVTVRGKTRVETTGNLVVAKFRHETNREQEPHLHTHAVILNMTRRADGKWRALTNDGLFQNTLGINGAYEAALAKGLTDAGFQLRYQPDGNFELAHFTREQITAFSTRSKQIEQELADSGLTRATATPGQKRTASLTTRKAKHEIDRVDLQRQWRQRADALGIDFAARDWAGPGAHVTRTAQPLSPEATADAAIAFAVASLTERQAVITETRLTSGALKHALGTLTPADIRDGVTRAVGAGQLLQGAPLYKSASDKSKKPPALTRERWIANLERAGKTHEDAARIVDRGIDQGRLRPTSTRYTTQTALQHERAILRMERDGRGASRSRVATDTAQAFLATRGLTDEQRAAAALIATTPNRYVGVQGFAGVGKSHMTLAAKTLLESQGLRVTSLAPYGSQRKELQALGLDSRTVAAFLKAKDKHLDQHTVVILDEAALVPTRQMHEVMQAIDQAGARAVLLGDVAQTKAIEAGRPFDQLQHAGMETAHLAKIQRQTDPELLLAVQLAAEGDSKASLAHLPRIEEIKQAEARHDALVHDYVQLAPEQRERTLIITGTNESRRALNNQIRTALDLKGKGRSYALLKRLDLTQAARRVARYYEVGVVVIPELDYSDKALTRGAQYEVLDNGPGNNLTVRAANGAVTTFDPSRYRQLSIYQRENQELAAGDRIRITRNDAKLDLANRDQFKVITATERGITAVNDEGRQITLDAAQPMFADLAYVSTVHSAQGLTADGALINLDTKSPTTSKDVYYVGISRARKNLVIYTDDRKALPDAVNREHKKTAALDLPREKQKGREERAHEVEHGERAMVA